MRHCGNCGKTGHYRSTCKGVDGVIGNTAVSKTADPGPNPGRPAIIDVTNINQVITKILTEEEKKSLPNYCGGLKPRFDQNKYPNLHAATERGDALLKQDKDDWQKVIALKAEGKDASADRLIRKIFGIHEPMSEEDKEKLRIYSLEHKEEIAEKAKQKREFERRTREIIEESSRKLDKKRNK